MAAPQYDFRGCRIQLGAHSGMWFDLFLTVDVILTASGYARNQQRTDKHDVGLQAMYRPSRSTNQYLVVFGGCFAQSIFEAMLNLTHSSDPPVISSGTLSPGGDITHTAHNFSMCCSESKTNNMPSMLQLTVAALLALVAPVSQPPDPGDELLFSQVQVRGFQDFSLLLRHGVCLPTLWLYAAENVTLSHTIFLQFVGTDQSHHQAPPQAVLDLLDLPLYQNAFANSTLDLPQGHVFSHLSITNQLNAGESVPLGQSCCPAELSSSQFVTSVC